MRRLIATAISLAFAGAVAFAEPGPAAADTVPATTTRAICVYGDPGNFWDLYSYRTIHYGSAHVTQCAYIHWLGDSYQCWQYVWNIPNPGWYNYQGDGDPSSPCW